MSKARHLSSSSLQSIRSTKTARKSQGTTKKFMQNSVESREPCGQSSQDGSGGADLECGMADWNPDSAPCCVILDNFFDLPELQFLHL